MATEGEPPSEAETEHMGPKGSLDPAALGQRLGSKLASHFDNGHRQGLLQVKLDERNRQKKEMKKITNQIKNDRRKVQRLTAKAKYLTNRDLSQILEVREKRVIKKEEKAAERAALAQGKKTEKPSFSAG